ncbi:MAG TPA: FAD-binding oxidoreductase [Solirubrobacteraceae bacterium]|nr:FAD-binding oxidoreductase [Solirubrobacteraceae bacterium]
MGTLSSVEPETFERAAQALAELTAAGRSARISGAGTKRWGSPGSDAAVPVRTGGLNRILAHDPGDMTATLQAGVPLAEAQERFAACDQQLALDPPTADPGGDSTRSATIGGIVATADCGPLAHRYGGPRDLVVGMTVALADGTIARSGGTVIKNVAGYDVAKLFCGSFGTLGLILSVNVRLHPRLPTTTAVGRTGDPGRLCTAARALAAMPAELEALDLAWEGGAGRLLARCAGPQAGARAQRIAAAMVDEGLHDVATDGEDEPLWERQRAGQRSAAGAVLRVAADPSTTVEVIAAAESADGSLVARAALGHFHLTVPPAQAAAVRSRLPEGAVSVLHDCPPAARQQIDDPWGVTPAGALGLMRALKARFDPSGTCNPGTFVGGI